MCSRLLFNTPPLSLILCVCSLSDDWLWSIVFELEQKKTKVPVIHVMASILAWASSVINPFIYAFSNRQYRSAYRQLLCGSSRSARLTSQTQTSRSSGRTFLTDMLHYTAHADKVKVIRASNIHSSVANKEEGDQQQLPRVWKWPFHFVFVCAD